MLQFPFTFKAFSMLLSNVNLAFDANHVNNEQMNFDIRYVFCSQYSHQLVSAGIAAIFVPSSLQE
jgi:hypothetical protein